MKHLGHQNRKKDVYDGDTRRSFRGHSGVAFGHFGVIVASVWGGFGAM